MEHKIEAQAKMSWIIRKGEMKISLDRWLEVTLHRDAIGPVQSLFLSNNELDIETSCSLIGYNNTMLIKQSMIGHILDDDLVSNKQWSLYHQKCLRND